MPTTNLRPSPIDERSISSSPPSSKPRHREAADAGVPVDCALIHVDLDLLEANPFPPRAEIDAVTLEELAASIAVSGFLQPIAVRRPPASLHSGGSHRALARPVGRIPASRRVGYREPTRRRRQGAPRAVAHVHRPRHGCSARSHERFGRDEWSRRRGVTRSGSALTKDRTNRRERSRHKRRIRSRPMRRSLARSSSRSLRGRRACESGTLAPAPMREGHRRSRALRYLTPHTQPPENLCEGSGTGERKGRERGQGSGSRVESKEDSREKREK
jgi:hypothetical protein